MKTPTVEQMIKFKTFDVDDLKTDIYGCVIPINLIFIDDGDVVRFGYLYEDYHGNGTSTYYFRSNGANYPTYNRKYSIVDV